MAAMSTPGMRPQPQLPTLHLDFPMSLGTFSEYAEAQRTVDYLSDHHFPVEQCMIVGTDLKQIERITGRLNWGRVLVGGLASGAWLGAFVGLIFTLFSNENGLNVIISTIFLGAIFGAFWAAIGYAATRGRRDFTSVSQVVATRYEVLVEHKSVQQARELLGQMNGDAAPPHEAAPSGPQRTYSEAQQSSQYGQQAPAGSNPQTHHGAQSPQYGQPGTSEPQQPEPPRYGQRSPESDGN